MARLSGFGPLQPYLDDPEVEEVWVNSPDRVFAARRGRHELTNLVLSRAVELAPTEHERDQLVRRRRELS